jgi:hypothetical protein
MRRDEPRHCSIARVVVAGARRCRLASCSCHDEHDQDMRDLVASGTRSRFHTDYVSAWGRPCQSQEPRSSPKFWYWERPGRYHAQVRMLPKGQNES